MDVCGIGIYIYNYIQTYIYIQKSWSQYGRTKVHGGNAKASQYESLSQLVVFETCSTSFTQDKCLTYA